MGGVQPTGGKGGKRAMDAHINLVPYIDLLMTIMTFLVMTAVWTKVANLEVQNATNGQPEEVEEKDDKPPPPIFVTIAENGLKYMVEGDTEPKEIPALGDGFDTEKLKAALQSYLSQYSDRMDEVHVKVKPEDAITYNKIVGVVDVITGLEFKGITIEPASSGS